MVTYKLRAIRPSIEGGDAAADLPALAASARGYGAGAATTAALTADGRRLILLSGARLFVVPRPEPPDVG